MRYFFLLLGFATSLFGNSAIKPNIHSRHALLMDIENGRVLYNKNGYDKIYPASTTKIATVLYLITHFGDRLDDQVEISAEILKSVSHSYKKEKNYELPPYWLQPDGTELGIKKGEKLPFRMLLYAALMISANDAANAMSQHVAKDIPTFMEGLNQFLRSIGCEHTHFNNPHGLHHPNHYSTPYDMAVMGRYAAQNPLFREICLTEEYERVGTKQQKSFMFQQKNRLLKEGAYYYPYAFGLKTGHTDPAQYNLVAAATNGQRTLVVALHKADKISQCYRDAITLFDAYFAEEPIKRLLMSQEETLFRTTLGKIPIKAELTEDVTITYYLSEEPTLGMEVLWPSLSLPIIKGSQIGELVIRDDKRVLMQVPLLASDTIRKPFNWYYLTLLLPLPLLLYLRQRSSKGHPDSRVV